MAAAKITIHVTPEDSSEVVEICIRRSMALSGAWEVFVDGGLLANGATSSISGTFRGALNRAVEEITAAAEGD